MATVLIPTALRAFTDGQSKLDISGKTAGEVIAAIAESYPDIKKHLYDDDGNLRSFVNVFVGEENIRSFGGLDAPVGDKDTVTLVPAIAGGSGVIYCAGVAYVNGAASCAGATFGTSAASGCNATLLRTKKGSPRV